MAILLPLIVFGPGLALGIWLGLRAHRDEPPSRLLPYAAIAWAATFLWGMFCWLVLFGPLMLAAEEVGEGALRVAQVAVVNALPAFLLAYLVRRARRGA